MIMNKEVFDCAIIGGGPAGMMAAIQLKRSGKSVILFEKNELGGLLRNANWVENYLGFPEGITGGELVKHFIEHLQSHNVLVEKQFVTEIRKNETLELVTKDAVCQAKSVILATGTNPRKLNLPGEETTNRLFYERVHFFQSPIYKDLKKVIIIGGGDVGFDSALNLKSHGIEPVILTRGNICCLPLLKERAEKENIEFHENIHFQEIQDNNDTISVICEKENFIGDAVLVTIGRNPAVIEINNLRETDGIFFTGDMKNGIKRHVQIATGDALTTALTVIEFLK